jgi:cobalamin biosynthesis Mg chelatase CobN
LGEASFEDLDASGEWKGKLFTLILEEEVDARYVKFTYTLTDGNKKFCWSSEAAVYGTATEQPSTGDESSTEESSEAETSEEETSTEASAESTPAESTPAESSAAPAEDGGSATLWIILGVAAATIAAVVGVLFARKKKA